MKGLRCLPFVCCFIVSIGIFILPTVAPSVAQQTEANNPSVEGYQSIGQTAATVAIPKALKRGFYLTNTSYTGSQALTACAKGYHMASMWELMDISTLLYHYAHPYAKTKDDSGYGPPSLWYGWVRTGWDSSGSSTAGMGNCLNWTSISASDSGTIVRLSNNWATPLGSVGPWDVSTWACTGLSPVWCVSDKK